MTQPLNTNCLKCDYQTSCHKSFKIDDATVLAKDQDAIPMPCVCVVQDECRNCYRYQQKHCASWKTLNGKERIGRLTRCPKKLAVEVKQ